MDCADLTPPSSPEERDSESTQSSHGAAEGGKVEQKPYRDRSCPEASPSKAKLRAWQDSPEKVKKKKQDSWGKSTEEAACTSQGWHDDGQQSWHDDRASGQRWQDKQSGDDHRGWDWGAQ